MPPIRTRTAVTTNTSAESIRASVAGGNSTERARALQELIYFFTKKSQGATQLSLDAKAYHNLVEALFQCALTEKRSYLSGKKTTKSAAEARLAATAEALRLAVNYGTSRLKRKMARAIVDHITQTLPGGDDYVKPLLQDYTKALVSLLSHPANVEQLGALDGEGWLVCADFVADAIDHFAEAPSDTPVFGTLSRASPTPGPSGAPTSTGRSGSIPKSRASSQKSSKILETLTQGLLYLVSAPNAPLQLRASLLSQCAIRVLRMQHLGIGHLQQAAFASIRCIVRHMRGDDVALGKDVAREVLPLIGHWWHPQSSASQSESVKAIREEILRTMFSLQLHIHALVSASPSGGILDDIKEVLDALWMEYSKRDDRAKLQASDIAFSFVSASHFHTGIFGLSTHDPTSERRWAAVEVMALLESMYVHNVRESEPEADKDEHPRKRRRVGERTERIRDALSSPDLGLQVTALQMIPFFLQATRPVAREDVSDMLSQLMPLISDKQAFVSSWAMVACASCAVQGCARDSALGEQWMQVWQIAARSVSLPGTSRAASALLHALLEAELVPHHLVGDDINNLVTVAEVGGPAVLCDASLILMLHLLHLRNTILPSANEVTSSQILRWAFSRWKPGESTFASLYAAHAPSFDIANLLMACIGGGALDFARPVAPFGGPISRTWKDHAEADAMMRYLLLLPEREATVAKRTMCVHSVSSESTSPFRDPASLNSAKRTVLELLQPMTDELLETAESWARRGDNMVQVSPQRMQSVVVFCMVCTTLTPQLDPVNSRLARELEPALLKLVDTVLQAVHEAGENSGLLEVWLSEAAVVLPRISAAESGRFGKAHAVLLKVLVQLCAAVRVEDVKQSAIPTDDRMALDEEFDAVFSQGEGPDNKTVVVPRQTLAVDLSRASFFQQVRQRLELLAHSHASGMNSDVLAEAFVDQFLAQPSEAVLLCHGLAQELFRSDYVVAPEDALRVVEVLGDLIGQGEYACCEVALCMCMDSMESFLCAWPDETPEVAARIGDLYVYLVAQALPKNSLSGRAQQGLASLLYRLLAEHASYGTDLGLPSCRSTLLSVLQTGGMAVKYAVGMDLARIFGLYVLKVHDDLFVDVLEVLPSDPDWAEGIAFRLLALARLACAWPTLLRRCIYHIFETPGRLRQSAQYATRCLQQVSTALALPSPQALFALFAPQLLYTWLEHEAIAAIPYEIFSFGSLGALIDQAQAEATALMLMRGQDAAVAEVARLLDVDVATLVQRNFARVWAYCVAHDMATATDKATGESRVRALLGRERFLAAASAHLADTVGQLFGLFDQEDALEKYLHKDAALRYAAANMAAIKACGHSTTVLPPNQQPMFRGKVLPRALAQVCSRTGHDTSTLWTPALVAAVVRRLLNTVRPALGSLHACAVVRKVRVVVCLADAQATAAYPLEQLLTALRPLVQDAECADDVLGLTRYLVERGAGHLAQVPSFYGGWAVSMLAALRLFLEASQASTTQESAFRATRGRAQEFHAWLAAQLAAYDSQAFADEAQRTAFGAMTQAATRIRAWGNAEAGTAESTLLLAILQDGERGASRLLHDGARELVLGMLCGDFRVPAAGRDDVLSPDEAAIAHGAAVWKSCRAEALSESYLVWAGRVVGRSFAASGTVPEELVREQGGVDGGSEEELLRQLAALTAHPESETAGRAEAALRTVVSQATTQDDSGLLLACQASLPEALFVSSAWGTLETPPSDTAAADEQAQRTGDDVFAPAHIEDADWAQDVAVWLAGSVADDVVLGVLGPLLGRERGFAARCFPYLVHRVLLRQLEGAGAARQRLLGALGAWLASTAGGAARANVRLLVGTLVYLWQQAVPGETSVADRARWLDVDTAVAGGAAARCGMFKTALQLVERGCGLDTDTDTELLLRIYENVDDPDAYYGLPQRPSLASVRARLEYEKDGSRALAFRGAQYDSDVRRGAGAAAVADDRQALVQALSSIGLSGLSHAVLAEGGAGGDSTYTAARRLGVWDLPTAAASSSSSATVSATTSATVYRAFQGVHRAADILAARTAVQAGLGSTMRQLVGGGVPVAGVRQQLGALAVLAELDEVLGVHGGAELRGLLARFGARTGWMRSRPYEDVRAVLSGRETTLGAVVGGLAAVRTALGVTAAEGRVAEVEGLLGAAALYRFHHAQQEGLNVATALTDLVAPSAALGLRIEAAVRMEAARALTEQGETLAAIGLLQATAGGAAGTKKSLAAYLAAQTVPVSAAALLLQTGQAVSAARLESADAIQTRYLGGALAALDGATTTAEAGQVFHAFARFCDEQLHSADSREDLARLQSLRAGKRSEVAQLAALVASARDTAAQQRTSNHLSKARQWLALDEAELARAERTRAEFVRLSIDNYLLALAAADTHNDDALRFAALWLSRAGEAGTNAAVAARIEGVPSRKLAPLMNQLSSRMQAGGGSPREKAEEPHHEEAPSFQTLLHALVLRICRDHPYHGMYQIWSGKHTRPNPKDAVAVRRQRATERAARELARTPAVAAVWTAIDRTSKAYHALAMERDSRYRAGQRIALRDSVAGRALVQVLGRYALPPPTLDLPLRADCCYDGATLPTVVRLEPTMTVAGGVSAPKILTCLGSDGQRYRQLVKGGNDDLRQDAIMEQVFAAVSALLQRHRATRQRRLGIRTYKVLPLTAAAGLIEFVPDTVPLHDYLMPAHERFYPDDLRGSQCRREIAAVQTRAVNVRIAAFRRVAAHFHPVLRCFFLESFPDPDAWFARRLAYARATAAVSVLGHVLGLGDRHGHNILLDQRSGEVVHIDLGVAFEMGRVLPVPELVPFRLTRDIVDGLGVTGTEGVFRRCCEFTLDALRAEADAIMTILDVLRYDPLYSWSISPVRLATLQARAREEEEAEPTAAAVDHNTVAATAAAAAASTAIDQPPVLATTPHNEPSEAERALEVVRKKLSKTLSVAATVHDLINQATDERNLAVLYCGWAAYA